MSLKYNSKTKYSKLLGSESYPLKAWLNSHNVGLNIGCLDSLWKLAGKWCSVHPMHSVQQSLKRICYISRLTWIRSKFSWSIFFLARNKRIQYPRRWQRDEGKCNWLCESLNRRYPFKAQWTIVWIVTSVVLAMGLVFIFLHNIYAFLIHHCSIDESI